MRCCGLQSWTLMVWFGTSLVAWGDEVSPGAAATNPPPVQAESEPRLEAVALTMETLDDQHKLGVGDRIGFRIREDDDPSVLLIVTDAGEIEVPYLGRIPAEGKTCRELAWQIKELLDRSYYYDCHVLISPDLIVRRSVGQITVTGAVGSPGVQELPPKTPVTASRAILNAGGFTQFANRNRVRLYRRSPDSTETSALTVRVGDVLERGRVELDVELQPDDMIVVSERILNF